MSNIEESSDKYEDDIFDSLSKSNVTVSNTVSDRPKLQGLKDTNLKPAELAQVGAATVSKYIMKENKGQMTQETKYDNISVAEPSALKEWGLKKNLEDAELLIQQLKANAATDKE